MISPPVRRYVRGEAERFIQTALREWAYARTHHRPSQRIAELPRWVTATTGTGRTPASDGTTAEGPSCSRDHGQEDEHRENHEVNGALQQGGVARRDGHGRQEQGQCKQDHFGRRGPQGDMRSQGSDRGIISNGFHLRPIRARAQHAGASNLTPLRRAREASRSATLGFSRSRSRWVPRPAGCAGLTAVRSCLGLGRRAMNLAAVIDCVLHTHPRRALLSRCAVPIRVRPTWVMAPPFGFELPLWVGGNL